jgi:hypothetical protein
MDDLVASVLVCTTAADAHTRLAKPLLEIVAKVKSSHPHFGMATRVLWCALAVALTKPSSALRDALPPATLTWMNESASCVFRQTGACDGAFGPREPEGDRWDTSPHLHAVQPTMQ